jgi:hypothetical protein
MGPPPGGPPDKVPPRLVSTSPESLGVYPEFKGSVDFQFDETLSEGGTPNLGTGTSELERVVLLSPTVNVPDVGWHRSRLSVKPKEGWRPNRVYRVELLPGVKDIRNNVEDSTVIVTFTTGAPLPTRQLKGRVIDWAGRQVARGALVAAVLQPDSLPYLIYADSGGRFDLEPLPPGTYLITAFVDQNHNRRLEPRELFDTVRVDSVTTEVPALWLQPHDTVPPRIQSIAMEDSTGATVELTGPLDPYATVPFGSFRLLTLPDSVAVDGASLVTKSHDDSLRAAEHARAQQVDTTSRKPPPPTPTIPAPGIGQPAKGAKKSVPDTVGLAGLLAQRPPLQSRMVLRVPTPFTPGAKYLLEIADLRGLGGVVGNVRGGLAVPVPKPVKTDSTSRRQDLPAPPADSARPK